MTHKGAGMPIAITDEHLEIAATVRDVLTAHDALAANRALLEADTEPRPSYWKEMAALGWLGIHLPEEYGGAGAGLSDLIAVLDELGRQVAPGPFLPTVLASAVIAQCGTDEQCACFLPALADGSVVAAVGLGGSLTLTDGVLDGDAGIVLGGAAAELLLLRAGDDVVVVLEPEIDGVRHAGAKDLDPSRRSAAVTVSSVGVRDADVLVGAARRARALARTLGAAEAVGVMAACTDAAVEYAKERVQFGRTIGTFQAVKHHCANMLVAAELATAAVWDAARAATDSAEEFDFAAAMAAQLTFAPAVHNAQMNIQVHGGIGFTWEHDAHLFLRRALVLNAVLGSPDDAEEVTALAARGTTREISLDLPPEAEAIRTEVRAEAERIKALRGVEQRKALVESGLMVPHWPPPWGRDAGAVAQIVIDEEFARRRREGPRARHHGLEHHDGEPVRDARPGGALGPQDPDGRVRLVSAVQRARRRLGRGGRQDAGDAGRGWLDGQRAEGVDERRPVLPPRPGHGADQPRRPEARGHHHHGHRHARTRRRGAAAAPDHGQRGLQRGLLRRRVRARRRRGGHARRRLDGGALDAGQRTGLHRGRCRGHLPGHGPDRAAEERWRPGARRLGARVGAILSKDHALKVLNLRRAQRAVIGSGPGAEGNVTKLVLAEHGHDRARLQADLVGPATAFLDGEEALAGYSELATRAMSIAGGTSEITRNQIAERILGLPRDPLIT